MTADIALAECLNKLLALVTQGPASREAIEVAVVAAITESQQYSTPDTRKSQWEYLLRREIYRLAELEEAALHNVGTTYYNELSTRLEIVLTLTEHGACEPTLPFSILQDLLEMQTITSCSHIFSWIELHSDRLTKDMVPQKGKALVLLRTLNDLLRRLSKTGNTTTFCGRILTFLSAVFPLGERSGVNLRGEYGPQWESVTYTEGVKEEKMDVDTAVVAGGAPPPPPAEGNAEVATTNKPSNAAVTKTEKTEEEVKEEFYNTFWWLQLPFSRPPVFAQPAILERFKTAINAVMPVIKEATVKERAMMGSKAVVGSLKRKREITPASVTDDSNSKYFFAKYLTSPDLLDLEMADTAFRRQFLFQLLILLSHLLQFTKSERARWVTNRNRSLQMDFTLEDADAKWVQDTIIKAYEELRQTAPNGRAFAETVQTILERERNWLKWKNELCYPFDKEPLKPTLEESTAHIRNKLRPDVEYKHKLGSAALTEIWAMGYRDLSDLQMPFTPGDVKDFVKDIEKENARIALRKQQLTRQTQARARTVAKAVSPAPAATATATPPPTSTNSGAEGNNSTVPPSSSTALAAPSAQRPPVPLSASPPLHPSLPAKPGSKPVVRPTTPVPTSAVPLAAPTPIPPAAPVIATPAASKPVPPLQLSDSVILKAEENKHRLSWLALRTARDNYLHIFGKIGNGDVILLAQEIENEKIRLQKGESAQVNDPNAPRYTPEQAAGTNAAAADGSEPVPQAVYSQSSPTDANAQADGDIQMMPVSGSEESNKTTADVNVAAAEGLRLAQA